MAFQYKLNDKRGNPKIKFLDGEWVVISEYYTSTEKQIAVQAFCTPLGRLFK